jgi:hypothetical protein
MRRAVYALAFALALLCACGSPAAETGGPAAPGHVGAPPTPVPTTPAQLVARTADEGEVVLHLSVARAHPLGPRLEPYVLAWPGWGQTIAAISPHPLAELDWIDVVGTHDAAKERMLSRTAAVVADSAMDTRVASPPSTDGILRVLLRGQAHLVVAAPIADSGALSRALLSDQVLDPEADAEEALHVDMPHPHDAARQIPEEARHLLLKVFSRPGGGAEAFAELRCDNLDDARHVAESIRDQAHGANNIFVRMLTHDLLGRLTIEVNNGTLVKLRLPADRDQLEALASLAAGFLPPGSSGAR